ncbi:MAG TPA: HD domain-containing protein, partial [Candidatus Methanoperedenaceae archaeon]|nr:HD domain-containing protein [Candidatus Methanoperedenaceae archaeon]
MKAIRDPVHGYIELGELPLSLLDTKEVQRLRRIRQLGLSHLVYPGANHTRFEHSLGVMHLAKYMTAHVEERYRDELVAAALLHDIGHGPLSHVTEELMVRHARRRHYDTEDILRSGEVSDVLGDFSLQPSNVSRHIRGDTHVGQILNSEIDVDRMDYL